MKKRQITINGLHVRIWNVGGVLKARACMWGVSSCTLSKAQMRRLRDWLSETLAEHDTGETK